MFPFVLAGLLLLINPTNRVKNITLFFDLAEVIAAGLKYETFKNICHINAKTQTYHQTERKNLTTRNYHQQVSNTKSA